MSRRSRKFDPFRLFHSIKLIAFEAALTIVFLTWLAKEVRHHIGWNQSPVGPPTHLNAPGAGKP